jgi:hypothetical protein
VRVRVRVRVCVRVRVRWCGRRTVTVTVTVPNKLRSQSDHPLLFCNQIIIMNTKCQLFKKQVSVRLRARGVFVRSVHLYAFQSV